MLSQRRQDTRLGHIRKKIGSKKNNGNNTDAYDKVEDTLEQEMNWFNESLLLQLLQLLV